MWQKDRLTDVVPLYNFYLFIEVIYLVESQWERTQYMFVKDRCLFGNQKIGYMLWRKVRPLSGCI